MTQDLRWTNWSTLDQRVKEHRHALTSMSSLNSALTEHAINHNHVIDWSGAKVLDGHEQRCSLEAQHITAQKQPLNRDEGTLPAVYNSLIVPRSRKCVIPVYPSSCLSMFMTFLYYCLYHRYASICIFVGI